MGKMHMCYAVSVVQIFIPPFFCKYSVFNNILPPCTPRFLLELFFASCLATQLVQMYGNMTHDTTQLRLS